MSFVCFFVGNARVLDDLPWLEWVGVDVFCGEFFFVWYFLAGIVRGKQ